MREQPALGVEAPRVADQAAARADDAVARNGNRDPVAMTRATDSTARARTTEPPRHVAVGRERAGRNVAQGAPHRLLEGRAIERERHTRKGGTLASEVGTQTRNEVTGRSSSRQGRCAHAFLQLGHERGRVTESQAAEAPVMVEHGQRT